MTREEAIKWIVEHNDPFMDETKDSQAHRLALQALQQPEIVRCRDCKYFEIKDWWGNTPNGIPILVADQCPTCTKWADGCMTKEYGYCYLGERKGEKKDG